MHLKTSALIAVIALIGVVGVAGLEEFPSALIERCRAGDGECLAKTFTHVLQQHSQGIPELGLAALDPLYFGNITVSQSGGPVSMTMRLDRSSILGWSKAVVTEVRGFEKDPRKSKFELHMKVPFDQIVGNYEMGGQLLLFAIKGAGKGKMQFSDLEMEVRFHTAVETRDGEDYLRLRRVALDITCKWMHIEFDNLFQDKALNENVHKVLNENNALIFNEMAKEFGRARGVIVRNLLQPMFDRFPYRMLFAPEEVEEEASEV